MSPNCSILLLQYYIRCLFLVRRRHHRHTKVKHSPPQQLQVLCSCISYFKLRYFLVFLKERNYRHVSPSQFLSFPPEEIEAVSYIYIYTIFKVIKIEKCMFLYVALCMYEECMCIQCRKRYLCAPNQPSFSINYWN